MASDTNKAAPQSSSPTTKNGKHQPKGNSSSSAASKNSKQTKKKKHVIDTSSSTTASAATPSMTMSFLISCVLPLFFVLLLSIYGEYSSSSSESFLSFMMEKVQSGGNENDGVDGKATNNKKITLTTPQQQQQQQKSSDGSPQKLPKEVEDMLKRNQLKQKQQQQQQQSKQPTQPQKPPATTSDTLKLQYDSEISKIRTSFQNSPNDEFKALALADALRARDLAIHDGGSAQNECIEMYQKAIQLIQDKKQKMQENNEPTNVAISAAKTNLFGNLNDEMYLDYTNKSVDGLLCAVYTALAKIYFMANMFERAVQSYDEALKIEPNYMDALSYRASTLIILGRYEEAAMNYTKVIEDDAQKRTFVDAFTGMSKILTAKESAVPNGWDTIVPILEEEIPILETNIKLIKNQQPNNNQRRMNMIANVLKNMHLAMFAYHDVKTKDTKKAWHHLSNAYEHKMSALPKWNGALEEQRVDTTTKIFNRGFWGQGTGSTSRVPIFIIGFVRSGSTLLERVLDAHPLIVGTGEDSVFNGRLEYIRNKIVEASMTGDPSMVPKVVNELAKEVVKGMRDRWKALDAASTADVVTQKSDQSEKKKEDRPAPRRFADKMLTNYMNVGFIHMLFPRALILHVSREPMDTVFSAFKHDFPPGTLDYTSEFSSLAQLYHGYRKIMKHWDNVLPGRVTHIRYEDMVRDMPNVARAIINATGLKWDEDVLQFHKKKQAVNTLSTTQVRKGVYSHHLKSWMKYEEELQPLVKLLGDDAEWDLKTTLPNYVPPPLVEEKEEGEE